MNEHLKIPQFPHCDARILHAPEDNCKYCNESGLQEIREAWGISFTGHHKIGQIMCPAEKSRGLSSINSWGGNIAQTPEVLKSTELYWEQVIKDLDEDITKFKDRLQSLKEKEMPAGIKTHIQELGLRLVDLD